MDARPTISDVAERAGFSTATVSAVINDKDTVSAATRKAVLKVIDEMNYRPREWARHRHGSSSAKTLGIIVKEDNNPFYGEVIEGVRLAAQRHGYLVVISMSGGSYAAERTLVEFMMTKEIGGLLMTPVLDDDADLSHVFELKRRNIPFVLLEQVRGVQANLVDIDNIAASARVTEYLIEQGHTRIVHFAGPTFSGHSEQRLEGARRIFSRSMLAFTDNHFVQTGASVKDGYRTGMEVFQDRSRKRPTAVTCYNDLVAIGLLTALKELGIRVPEEVSVVGFDDLELASYLPWRLSTVSVPKYEMGEQSAEILIRQLESGKMLPLEKLRLDFELILRDTTAPCSDP